MTLKKLVWPAALLALIVALAIGSWPSGSGPENNADRASRLAAEIRCPTCAGLSVAESESPLAQSARAEIATQVAAGESDDTVIEYFVDRYGNTALMNPPREGLALYAWLAPVVLLVAAGAGLAFAVVKWRRRERLDGATFSEDDELAVRAAMADPKPSGNHALLAERDAIFAQLRRTEEERASGAITDDEYRSFYAQQTTRAAGILRELDAPAKPPRKLRTFTFSSPKKQQRATWAGVGALFVIVALVAVGFSTSDRLSGENITGDTPGDVGSLLSRAAEQTASGEAAEALSSYDRVLRVDPDNTQALAYRGWLLRLANYSEQGEASIDQAIAADPAYADARFFKGYILLRDRNDPQGAIAQFDAFLASNPPAEMVSLVEQARADAVTMLSNPTATTTTVSG